jgi:hypothetical protein
MRLSFLACTLAVAGCTIPYDTDINYVLSIQNDGSAINICASYNHVVDHNGSPHWVRVQLDESGHETAHSDDGACAGPTPQGLTELPLGNGDKVTFELWGPDAVKAHYVDAAGQTRWTTEVLLDSIDAAASDGRWLLVGWEHTVMKLSLTDGAVAWKADVVHR